MTKQQAIKILERQRDKIDSSEHPNDETWIFQTAEYIRQFFSETSTQYSFISQFTFAVRYNSMDNMDDVKRWMHDKPILAKQFLADCIEFINDNGLHKQPQQNFLQRFNDTWLSAILFAIASAIGTIAFMMGQNTTEIKNIESRQELKHEKDSLSDKLNAIMHISKSDTLREIDSLNLIMIGSYNYKELIGLIEKCDPLYLSILDNYRYHLLSPQGAKLIWYWENEANEVFEEGFKQKLLDDYGLIQMTKGKKYFLTEQGKLFFRIRDKIFIRNYFLQNSYK